ncbi:MAG: lytic transglycosylase domain-containing protein [Actinomycetota bacterium]|nr:lytic transglycosylase domain-containing protein [Actinomycetota bacterium]
MQPAPLSDVLLHAERTKRHLAAVVLIAASSACSGAGGQLTARTPPPTVAPAPPASVPTTRPTATTPTTTAPPTTHPYERARPTSAESLAAELTEAETAIRDPNVDTETGRAWGRRAQQLYGMLTANPSSADEVLATVGEEVAVDVELNWTARQNLSALVTSTSLATQLPAWRIDEAAPPEVLLGYYREAEASTGVPWTVLAAINLIETRMGRIEGLSTAGAVGPMQFLPSTWEACCKGDPTVDRDAILGAAAYLEQSGALSDLDGAIFAYNHSDRYVRAVRAYADILARDALAYRGFHGFEVYFLSSVGLLHLAPGYEEQTAVDAATWVAAHPDALVD